MVRRIRLFYRFLPAFLLLMLALLLMPAFAQERPLRPVHTFSIVASDPATGEMGVAVQSHWFAVGGEVPWAEAGVGAVATQSFIDPSYGPLGLNLMRAGKSAPDALRGLLIADAACNVRQVAMVDTQGRVATFTGAKDIEPAVELPALRPGIRSRSNVAASPAVPYKPARTMQSRPI